ncbi:MAG: carboxypeptidase regulatory-like domain-containing protein [Myxococcales bacterium]|nr:carboxypeptidase regulatory-like domain-containing protein [Myxococcales bacterium]
MKTAMLVSWVMSGLAVGCAADEVAVPEPPPLEATAIRGWVMDVHRDPIAGVSVTSSLGPTTTDASGRFELAGAMSAEVLVTFVKEGYVRRVDKTRLVAGQITARHAVLVAEDAALPLDASVGGTVVGARGAALGVPPHAFADGNGVVVTGLVDVHLTPIDPSLAEGMAVGGTMQGKDTGGGATMLESFGMLDVTVRRGGEELRLAGGKTLDIAIAVPDAVATAQSTTGLWAYDEASALWVEEGTMSHDGVAGTYRATIGHLSFWNADRAVERSCVCGRVVDGAGAPLSGVLMALQGVDYLGVTAELSEAPDGRFCAVVRRDSQVSIGPYPFALGGVARTVATGAVDSEIPPQNGGVACVDVGAWVIDPGVYFPPGSGANASGCDFANSALAGSCVEPLSQLDVCWQPEGTCSVEAGESGFVIVYENGAKLVGTSIGPDGLSGDYLGPDGTLCGSFAISADGAITLTLAGGESWVIAHDQQTGATTYTCPDGTLVVVSAAEGAAVAACYQTDAQQCAVSGNGGYGQPCLGSACDPGLVCCALGQGMELCLDEPTCDAATPP